MVATRSAVPDDVVPGDVETDPRNFWPWKVGASMPENTMELSGMTPRGQCLGRMTEAATLKFGGLAPGDVANKLALCIMINASRARGQSPIGIPRHILGMPGTQAVVAATAAVHKVAW